tara:strand:+ start:21184 stop:21561 length:378 start_codon:yes stop_codon:yes gene_type:complete
MRGIVINPYTKTIEEVIIKKNDINSVYSAMTWLGHEVSIVQVAFVLPQGDNLLVDEEGALKMGRPVWKLNGIAFVGCGLFLGSDNDGANWCSAKIPMADLHAYTTWTTIVSTGEVDTDRLPHEVR